MKRVLCLSLVLTMICALLTFMPVNAATIVDSGNCGAQGDNVKWTLDSEGTLTISGTGEMADYFGAYSRPWGLGLTTVKNLIIKPGITYIGSYTFSGLKIQSTKIENGVLKIGQGAFWDSSLKSITIADSVTEIEDSAFARCEDLSEIHLPKNIVIIGSEAFSGTGIKTVDIPKSVITIGAGAFDINNLTDINVETDNQNYSSENGVLFNKSKTNLIQCPRAKTGSYKTPSTLVEIESGAFRGCDINKVIITENTKTIGSSSFMLCYNLTDINIPSGVETIGKYAFWGSGIRTIEIPDSVNELGENVFYLCENLENAVLGKGIQIIPQGTFAECPQLKSVIIPNGITEIGPHVFSECESLKTVTMAKSVNKISFAAFNDCKALKDVYYAGSEQEWEKINIDTESMQGPNGEVSNDALLNATIHYNSPMPGEPGILITSCTVNGANVDIINLDGISGTVVLAVYNKNGALRFMTAKSAADTVAFDNVDLADSNIKVMLWSDTDSIKPLTETAEMSL